MNPRPAGYEPAELTTALLWDINCNKLWQSTFASYSWEVDISRPHYHVRFLPLCQLYFSYLPAPFFLKVFLEPSSHTLTTRINHFSHLLQYNYNIYNTQISSVYIKFYFLYLDQKSERTIKSFIASQTL